jgi:1-acyl-sn-glycerol-3-phosphate acyltransferase
MAKKNTQADIQAELEMRGNFDHDITPPDLNNVLHSDKNYIYDQRDIGFRLLRAFMFGVLFIFGNIFTRVVFGLRVYGKENLKSLKKTGAISISNHVHYIDNLMLRSASNPQKNLYYIVAPFNCKKGFAGTFLKSGGVTPLPEGYQANKNFMKYIKLLLSRGKLVHFYPERSMWIRYQKPRPFKNGAFYYASVENAPILPYFIAFAEPKGLRKLFNCKKTFSVFIMKPIYPNKELSVKENEANMRDTAYKMFVEKYREFYGVTDECIYTIDPDVTLNLNSNQLA